MSKEEIIDNLGDILLELSDKGIEWNFGIKSSDLYSNESDYDVIVIYVNKNLTDRVNRTGFFSAPDWFIDVLIKIKGLLSDNGYDNHCSVKLPADKEYLGDIEELFYYNGLVQVIEIEFNKIKPKLEKIKLFNQFLNHRNR